MELTGYTTLRVGDAGTLVTATLGRPAQQNSLNAAGIRELARALDYAEQSSICRAFVIEGAAGVFCTGMDFTETEDVSGEYMALLRRLSLSRRIVVALADGRVAGGGVGLAAASDLVVATPRSEFSLPEALWGLVPCCVLPYLIRRVGFQRAYRMALTTQTVSAAQALDWSLVDEVHDRPHEAARRLLLRSARIHEDTMADLKRYARTLCTITPPVEEAAVEELSRLLRTPRVQERLSAFVERGQLPGGRRDG